MSIAEIYEKCGCYFSSSVKNQNWYISFENDIKDRLIYIDNEGVMFYKKNGKKINLTENQQKYINSKLN
jgi:hypothetical protein